MGKMLVAIGTTLIAFSLLSVAAIASAASDLLTLLFGNSHIYYRLVPNDPTDLVPASIATIGVLIVGAGIVIHRRRVKD